MIFAVFMPTEKKTNIKGKNIPVAAKIILLDVFSQCLSH